MPADTLKIERHAWKCHDAVQVVSGKYAGLVGEVRLILIGRTTRLEIEQGGKRIEAEADDCQPR